MDHVTSVIGCLAAPLLGPRSDPGAPVPSPRPPWRWPSSLRYARGPARIPGLPRLDHRGGGRLRPATDARGAAAGSLPGARLAPPPLRFPGPGSHLRRLPSTFAPLVARRGPIATLFPLRRQVANVCHANCLREFPFESTIDISEGLGFSCWIRRRMDFRLLRFCRFWLGRKCLLLLF